jgi:hypothetical protein
LFYNIISFKICFVSAQCPDKNSILKLVQLKMGTRTGRPRGRPPGAKNKRTKEREAAVRAAAAAIEGTIDGAFEGDAHTFLIAIYKDPEMPLNVRVDAAKAAIGYEKPRLNASEHNLKSSDETVAEWLKALDGRTRGIPSGIQ